MKMSDYSQPDFYRFNEDSIHLVNYAVEKKLHPLKVLDLCAGSGVVGLEYVQKVIGISQIDFLELQNDFEEHLKSNLSLYLPHGVKANYYMGSLSQVKISECYDLILCNPPYYLPHAGQASKDRRKGLCRSFLVDGWEGIFQFLKDHLKMQGRGIFIIKNDKNLREWIKACCPSELMLNFNDTSKLTFVEIEHKVR